MSRTFKSFLLIFCFSSFSIAAEFLNQNDPALKALGFQFYGTRSSLCGPISVMNWLQWKNAKSQYPTFTKQQLIEKLLQFRHQMVLDQGMTEDQIQNYLKLVDPKTGQQSRHIVTDSQNLFSSRAALMLVATTEESDRDFYFNPDDAPYRSLHWVLKTDASENENWVEFVDPEQPHVMTRMKVETIKAPYGSHFLLHPLRMSDLAFQIPVGIQTRTDIISLITLE